MGSATARGATSVWRRPGACRRSRDSDLGLGIWRETPTSRRQAFDSRPTGSGSRMRMEMVSKMRPRPYRRNGTVTPHFPEVEHSLRSSQKWTWQREGEGIFVYEARALLRCLECFIAQEQKLDVRCVLLVDNMGVCLSFGRRRTRNFKVLTIIRRFSAACMAMGIRASIRWIPSEVNIADEPSRRFEKTTSFCSQAVSSAAFDSRALLEKKASLQVSHAKSESSSSGPAAAPSEEEASGSAGSARCEPVDVAESEGRSAAPERPSG